MRLHSQPMLAVLALCIAASACHAAGDTPAAAPSVPASAAPASGRSATRHHWRHWSHFRHGRRAADAAGDSATGSDFGRRGRSGHGHSLRWHTVRDRHGNRHKEWYYADTGESASGPDGDAEPVRDLEAPMSRDEASAQHERRVKALAHLAEVEERVERDRRRRDANAKAKFHRILAGDAVKARAPKK